MDDEGRRQMFAIAGRLDDRIAVDVQFTVSTLPGMSRERAREIISRVCREVARLEELKGAEVAVSLVSDRRIRELNRQYRNRDAVTDVLSFAMQETVDGAPMPAAPMPAASAETVMLGDIVVSWPRVKAQAGEYGHGLERELAFLVAHGMFHLLGYDHQTPGDERMMADRQEEVLQSLGFVR